MNRFFVAPGTLAADEAAVPEAIAHQVRRVLRLADGDRIVLLEGDGTEAVCRLAAGATRLVVESRRQAGGEPAHRLTVCQALVKGDRLEEAVAHGTEVGVARFRLVVTERTIVRDLPARRLERLRTVAREAAEQSERGVVPPVDAPVPLAEVLDATAVVLAERHEGVRLGELAPPSTLVVGPEGGFGPAELEAAVAAGATLAWLGPRILRAETVAPVAAAIVLSRAGDFA